MTIASFFQKPSRDNPEENWLLPNLFYALYWISIVCLFIVTTVVAIELYREAYFASSVTHNVWNFFLPAIAITICWPVLLILELAVIRVWYEIGILLFEIFSAICNLSKEAKGISSVQIQTSQYVCDRLANICEDNGVA